MLSMRSTMATLPLEAPMLKPPKPWALVAGGAVALVGLGLLANSFSAGTTTSLRVPLALALGFSVLELSAGLSLMKRHDVGTVHIISGGTNLVLAALLWFLASIPSSTPSPQAVVLLLGLSCACNAIVRGLDALILRARFSFPALLGALLFAALAALALSTWREATSHSVERLVGAVVFLGGLVLAATANEPDDV
jgi:hypothetical protein